jgi:hypothetical protein
MRQAKPVRCLPAPDRLWFVVPEIIHGRLLGSNIIAALQARRPSRGLWPALHSIRATLDEPRGRKGQAA